MASKKRGFIDLTGDSDDDSIEPVLRTDPRGGVHVNVYGGPQTNENMVPPIRIPSIRTTTTPHQTQHTTHNPSSTTFTDVASREPIVQPLDWSKARRNHSYDPRTIARDVLIATNSHPDRKGLNAHLAVLKTRYSEVNDHSDLSTLRWDLIKLPVVSASQPVRPTPQGSATTVSKTVLPSIETFEKDSESGGDISSQFKPVGRSGELLQQRETTLVLLEDSKSTSPRKSSKGLDTESGRFGESHSTSSPNSSVPPCIAMPPTPDFSSFHVLPIHRSPKPTRGGSSSRGRGSHRPSLLRNSSAPAENTPSFSVLMISPSQPKSQYANLQLGIDSIDSIDSTAPASENSSISGTPGRGRPPKTIAGLNGTPPQPPSTVKKRGRPFKNSNNSQSASPAPGVKKRGRPFKTAEAETAAASGSPSSDIVFKRRGRPPKAPIEPVFLPPPEPKFHPFICEWEECPAELHNLETLRNHLFDVHVKKTPEMTCLWGKCGAVYGTRNAETEILRRENQFDTKKELRGHINHAHIVPQAWYMGDGPRGTSLEIKEKLSRQKAAPWLYDANGKQVTPSFEDLPVEHGNPKENNAKRFMRKREGLDIVLVPIETGDSPPPKMVQISERWNGHGNAMNER